MRAAKLCFRRARDSRFPFRSATSSSPLILEQSPCTPWLLLRLPPSTFLSFELQFAGRTWFFRDSIAPIFNHRRKCKVVAQMGYVFEERNFMAQGDVIE